MVGVFLPIGIVGLLIAAGSAWTSRKSFRIFAASSSAFVLMLCSFVLSATLKMTGIEKPTRWQIDHFALLPVIISGIHLALSLQRIRQVRTQEVIPWPH
jgi:hypothetical protein